MHYRIWQRPVINWNIECESNMTRQQAHDFILKKQNLFHVSSDHISNFSFSIAALTILGINLISTVAGGCTRSLEAVIVPCFMFQIMSSCFILASLAQTFSIVLKLKESLDLLTTDHSFFNSCVDAKTKFGT